MRKWLLYLLIIISCVSTTWAQESKQVVASLDGRHIRECLILGPFLPNDADIDFLNSAGGEANIQPYKGMAITAPDGSRHAWKRYKSQSDYINLQDAMKQLLFSADLEFQNELDDSKQPSADLRQVFEDKGFHLSEKATITIDIKGSRWWMVDKDNPHDYIILKAEEKLNVYSEPRDMIGYAACYLLSPKAQHLEMVIRRFNGVKVWVNGTLTHNTPEPNRWDTERFGISLE